MKVLHTIPSMSIGAGGPTTCTYTLLKGLIKSGIDTKVLTFEPGANDQLISEEHFIKTIKKPGETRFGFSKLFKTALKNYSNVDLIHANYIWQYVTHASGTFARQNKIPFVLSTHGMLYPEALKKSKYVKKISLALYQRSDLDKASVIHATCKQEMEHIRAMGIKTPIAVISNPVEISGSAIPTISTPANKRIGFIGRFEPIKNIENLIHAWALSLKNNSNCELVLIGDGTPEYKQSLVKLAESLDIRNILFPGFLSGNAKEEMFNSLAYLVLPSKSENFGMVVPEALIKGIPVIASKGTPWEELNTRKAGWWIEPGVEPLVESLKNAFQIEELERQEMGKNGRSLVEESYSIESVSKQMIELYDWVLGKIDKPSFVFID